MKRTSALRPILFPGSSPTWQELGPHVLRQHTLCIPQQEKWGGGGGGRKCFDKKQRKWPPQKILKPQRNVNFAKGGTPLFDLNQYVLLNKVWFSGCWVLNRSGIQFHYLASCTGCLFGLQASKWVWIFGILIAWVTVTIHHHKGGLLSCLLCEELHALWSLEHKFLQVQLK